MTDNNNLCAGNASTAALGALKSNPKPLYGLIGPIVLGSLALALSGCDDSNAPAKAAISKGQSVVLENPNGGLSHVTAAPGMMGAQTAEEDVEQDICVAESGTPATVEDEQVTGMLPYVKVSITGGPCQGKSGWTTKVNVKAQ